MSEESIVPQICTRAWTSTKEPPEIFLHAPENMPVSKVGLYLDLPPQLVLHAALEQLALRQDLEGHDVLRPALPGQVHLLTVARCNPAQQPTCDGRISARVRGLFSVAECRCNRINQFSPINFARSSRVCESIIPVDCSFSIAAANVRWSCHAEVIIPIVVNFKCL